MQFARRAFLRALPGAVAAAPIVAKAAADELIGKHAGLGTFSAFGNISGGEGGMPNGCAPSPQDPSLIRDFFHRFGLPEFERARIWEETAVGGLDPDIAAKQSWSMSVKILTQRQRNFNRRIDKQYRHWGYEDARAAFQQKHGFWWWW